jgi:multiple inositol-polyphosphate phosphatase/2,3-bisphosphoglycerate 3-phosphatase
VKQFNKFHGILQGHHDAMGAYPWMRNWTNPFDLEDADYLTVQGEYEHYYMAKRALAFYKDLLGTCPFEPSRYDIHSTEISRAGMSASAYSFGLFEKRGQVGPTDFDPFFIVTNNATTDNELRFFKTCPNYISGVKKNKKASAESQFYANKQLPGLADKLTKRINVTGWTLTTDDVNTLWTLCVFQLSAQEISDQFCSFFDKDDVGIMNYIDDLSSYWVKGYGYPINYEISCVLMQNFVDAITQVTSNPVDTHSLRATLRFAHAETVMPFLSLLGLFNDSVPLRATNTQEQIDNRLWRQSIISTFAANVALVTYNCSKPGGSADFRVKLFHSEKEYQIPQCDNKLYCPFEKFKEIYARSLTCDFNKLCGIEGCPANSDADDPTKLLSHKTVIILVVCVGAGGIIVGALALTAVLCVVRCFRRRHEEQGYELAADSVIL